MPGSHADAAADDRSVGDEALEAGVHVVDEGGRQAFVDEHVAQCRRAARHEAAVGGQQVPVLVALVYVALWARRRYYPADAAGA